LSLEANCVYTLTAVYEAALPWRNGLPPITQAVVVHGNGAVIERDPTAPNFRLFYIAAGGSLTMSDLTLRHGKAVAALGHASAGGAIYTEGVVLMQGVTLTANTAEGGFGINDGPYTALPGHPALGGAIFVAGGVVDITHSTFSNNRAVGGSAAEYVCSTSTPDDCRYNSADGGAEYLDLHQLGNFGVGGQGGESLDATPAPGSPGGYGGGEGGAGRQSQTTNIGGAPHLVGGPGGGGGGGGFGGGLFVEGGSVTLTDSTFTGNLAIGGLGGLGEGSGCCHSPAGQPGQGLGADIFWRSGAVTLNGTQVSMQQAP
jgi:hypothetical protein